MNTENIVKFMQANYSDEKLAALLAHCQDGKFAFSSCCCFIGIATADHALRGVSWYGEPHYIQAMKLPFAAAAHSEIANASSAADPCRDYKRAAVLEPLIVTEMERRAALRASAVQESESRELVSA